jgi:dTDP-4-amino-4,6-dideoxygalactose transaminase
MAISTFQGRLGCMLLDRMENDLVSRLANANALTKAMHEIPGVTVIREIAGVDKVHFIRLPTLIADGKRNQVVEELLNAGIEASPMYVEHGLEVDSKLFPGAARLAAELMTLPCHPYVTSNDIDLASKVISRAVSKENNIHVSCL